MIYLSPEQLFSSECWSCGSATQRRQWGYTHVRLCSSNPHRYIRVLLSACVHGLVGWHVDVTGLRHPADAQTARCQASSHTRARSEVPGEEQQTEISRRPTRRGQNHSESVRMATETLARVYMVGRKKRFWSHPFLYLLVSWAWWDWPVTWWTNYRPSVLWCCWFGHMTRKIVSEISYNVSSGTLNPTVPIPILCNFRFHSVGQIE